MLHIHRLLDLGGFQDGFAAGLDSDGVAEIGTCSALWEFFGNRPVLEEIRAVVEHAPNPLASAMF